MRPSDKRLLGPLERVVRVGVGLSVSLLVWPAEDDLRRQMGAVGQPRLLLVDPEVAPPELLDSLEDWVRTPADAADVEARAKALLARVTPPAPGEPSLDDDGLLHVGASWVVIPSRQVAVMRLLLDNVNRVVRTEAITEACVAAGASGHPASVRTLLTRLGARVRPVGLELVTVRQRGVLLRRAEPVLPVPPDG